MSENKTSTIDAMSAGTEKKSGNFIKQIIEQDLAENKNNQRVHTRFPPEPNGYLHIGHAKSICLNFGLANDYRGMCNLRFDDTNPTKEEEEYVDSIQEDVRWLGFDWQERLYFASDYYEQLYGFALQLIQKGKAYVCDLSPEQIREYRGTLTQPGKESPFRNRTVEENLELFQRMKTGEFEEGTHVLRAKIDMASPNLNMRDPVIYRILKASHHRTGDKWCIYPMYDYAHPISDSLEQITHSICTLEFEDHRPLYEWCLEQLDIFRSRQIEFARLNLNYTVMSKRKLLKLVKERYVQGWDDPRMPTISGLRRRGYTPASIRNFAELIGVSKADSTVDIGLLEHCLREDLNKVANRVMVVLKPLKVIIDNYPENQVEWLEAENNPEEAGAGNRQVPFCREIYIEQDDFREDPPKKYFRLSPGQEIRLKHAYYIKCEKVVKDENNQVIALHCSYDPQSRGGWSNDGRKVKGTSHWVSARHAVPVEVRLYGHLFSRENPEDDKEGKTFLDYINHDSLEILTGCMAEPGMAESKPGSHFQFLRQGYFTTDKESRPDHPVFNRSVSLKDSWAKIEKKMDQD